MCIPKTIGIEIAYVNNKRIESTIKKRKKKHKM